MILKLKYGDTPLYKHYILFLIEDSFDELCGVAKVYIISTLDLRFLNYTWCTA